jgi:hypothetical protein
VAPANDAIKTKGNVRVALAVSGTGSLRVSLDRSDVTRRLARRDRLREAVLRGRLVKPGTHWLVVRWHPAEGRAEPTIERRFLVARRFRSLAGKLFRVAACTLMGWLACRVVAPALSQGCR